MHGLGGSTEFWHAVIPHLVDSRRIVAVDIPGFGRSDPAPGGYGPDALGAQIATLIEGLGLSDVTLVGHSMGGIIAAAAAGHLRGIVGSLVLVDGHVLTAMDFFRHPLRVTMSDPGLTVALLAQFAGAAVSPHPSLTRLLLKSRLARRVALWPFVAHPASIDPDVLVPALVNSGGIKPFRQAREARKASFDELLAALDIPVRLIYGDKDRLIRKSDERISSLVDVVSEAVLEDTGHWPMVEHPAELARELREC